MNCCNNSTSVKRRLIFDNVTSDDFDDTSIAFTIDDNVDYTMWCQHGKDFLQNVRFNDILRSYGQPTVDYNELLNKMEWGTSDTSYHNYQNLRRLVAALISAVRTDIVNDAAIIGTQFQNILEKFTFIYTANPDCNDTVTK